VQVYFNRAKTYEFTGSNRDQAIADYDQAIKLKPNHAEAYFRRGAIYLLGAEYDQAIADYDRALQLSPEYPDALYGRGAAKTHKGDVPGGQADIVAAQKLQADVATVAAKRGIKPAA